MTYVSGFVTPVSEDGQQAYLDFARASWPIFRKHGALRLVETWGEDVPPGKRTDFRRAVDAKDGETVVFSWIEWPDRATCDAAWPLIAQDPEMAALGDMPFDGQRMIWGGFTQIFDGGKE